MTDKTSTTEEENAFLLQTIDDVSQALALPFDQLVRDGYNPVEFFRDISAPATASPDAGHVVTIAHAIADMVEALNSIYLNGKLRG